jgi:hypothetical protein
MKNPCKLISAFLFFFIYFNSAKAQVPTVQDCLGAIPVCQDSIIQDSAFSGTGNYPNEITYPLSCLASGEKNDVWYTFTVQTTGILNFTITPNNSMDDYDWAVFDITNHKCEDIQTINLQLSCNYAGNNGNNGATGANNGTNQQSSPAFSVGNGHTYVLNVSNYSSSQSGYLLDFSASTAQLHDNINPVIDSNTTIFYNGDTLIKLFFSENVYCSSVQLSDFSFSGSGGPYTITNITSPTCSIGADYGHEYDLTFSPPINVTGTFTLTLLDSIYDLCYNPALFPVSFSLRTCGNTSAVNQVSCGSYTSPSGNYNWTSSGTYMDTVLNSSGCDSIITVNLTINNSNSSIQNISACDHYTSPSLHYTWVNTGTYTDTIPNAGGCDSVMTINLTIKNSTGSTQSVADCNNYISPSGNYNWTTSGVYHDTIPNAAGCDSVMIFNLTINSTTSSQNVSSCFNYTPPGGNYTWVNSGTYIDTIPNAAGCDSVMTIHLTIKTVDTTITQNGFTLTANASGGTYQWLDCDNNFAVISGAINKIFTASANGNYAVAITQNGCTDTSLCYTITGVGIEQLPDENIFKITPNPAHQKFQIQLKGHFKDPEIIISNLTGQVYHALPVVVNCVNEIELSTNDFAEGIYFVQLRSEKFTQTRKLIVVK